MHKTFTLAFALTLTFFFSAVLPAQEAMLWPGDVDNNGHVNGIDLLYWNHAYGAAGPVRAGASTDWVAQLMGEEWDRTYPSGHNFAYADVDGDGRVTSQDLTVLFNHQNRTHPMPPADELYVLPDSTDNYEATLGLEPAGIRLTAEGTELLLDVILRGRSINFHRFFRGISFQATLPAGAFADFQDAEDTPEESLTSSARRLVRWTTVDSTRAQLTFTGTLLPGNAAVKNILGRIALPLAAGLDPQVLQNDSIVIDSLAAVDLAFQLRPVATKNLVLDGGVDCSFSVNPVCGSDGV
ncbi:MAG: dockerin type I domain-containing protein, partial [Bacteroidota bacterium]